MSLSQIKQTVRPGDVFDLTNHYITREDHPCYGTRRGTVTKVTSVSFYLDHGDAAESRIDWTKAAQVKATPDGFALYGGGVSQQPTDLFLTLHRVKPEPEPEPDRYAHLSRCMNDGCGLPIYYVHGELVDAHNHGAICDDEDNPHKDPKAPALVEVQPLDRDEDGDPAMTTADAATMWGVYFRTNEGLAAHRSDHLTKRDAQIEAHRVAYASDVEDVRDHDGKPLPTVALESAQDLVGQHVVNVTERQLVAKDAFGDYVEWIETTLTLASGRHYSFAVESSEVYGPVLEPSTCACGHLIVQEEGGWVHPFSYDAETPVHDPEPATADEDLDRCANGCVCTPEERAAAGHPIEDEEVEEVAGFRIGTRVRTTDHGFVGTVKALHATCPMGAAQIMGQEVPLDDAAIAAPWLTVHPDDGGSMYCPTTRATILD